VNKWARKLPLPDNVWFQVQNPVGLTAQQSGPQPDMTWIAERNYASRSGARDVFLLIEVSDSTLDYDRGEKAELYASARIRDDWIVNIGDECVEVRRNPRRGRYTSLEVFRPGERVSPLAFPDLALPVRLLFDKAR